MRLRYLEEEGGEDLPVAVVKELMAKGRTEKQVTGFRGRSGRTFRAKLALEQNDEGKWRVEFDEEWAKQRSKPPQRAESPSRRAGARRSRPAPSK